ncbi:serine protease [Streptomyces sp. NBC_01549]|uniref:S1 family peptidase n=1 Tax=Streptomyces sp. NBC_01549 TaxID=2975874 RepID=UPI002255CC0C|nr:serine protease [Streptomyces sp. NBC_01549]MCX4598285.1 serine protease [Streptomyces sp. NBC_01549]
MLKQIDATTLYSAVRLTVRFSEYGATRPGAGIGTGFIVRAGDGRDDAQYLVTNRHVVDPNYTKKRGWELSEVRIHGYFQKTREPQSSPVWQEAVLRAPVVHTSPAWHVDLAVLPLGTGDGLEVVAGSGRFNSLPVQILANRQDFSRGEVTVGRQVLMPGYPGINETVAKRPILVGGVIATDPRFPAAVGADEYPDEVLCHAFSWNGMSGSPVLCMVPRPTTWDDFGSGGSSLRAVLAGVNAGHIEPRSDAAAGVISRFVRGDVLAGLLRQAGVDIFELPFD